MVSVDSSEIPNIFSRLTCENPPSDKSFHIIDQFKRWEEKIKLRWLWNSVYIINYQYDSEFDYKRRRNETEYEDEHVHYSFYQGGPRIKPESYSGTKNWEEYQSHMWDHRRKVLFLTAWFTASVSCAFVSRYRYDILANSFPSAVFLSSEL